MKSIFKNYCNVLEIAILFTAAGYILSSCRSGEVAPREVLAVPVSVQSVVPGTIEQYINATGTIYPFSEAVLTSQMSGEYYLNINPGTNKKYVLGDMVKKGEIIIRLKDEEFMNNLREKSNI